MQLLLYILDSTSWRCIIYACELLCVRNLCKHHCCANIITYLHTQTLHRCVSIVLCRRLYEYPGGCVHVTECFLEDFTNREKDTQGSRQFYRRVPRPDVVVRCPPRRRVVAVLGHPQPVVGQIREAPDRAQTIARNVDDMQATINMQATMMI